MDYKAVSLRWFVTLLIKEESGGFNELVCSVIDRR